jgi:hypothetical protein
LPVEVIGADLYGQQFFERAKTLTIHRNGVSILLTNDLAPDTEVILRNPETNAEAIAAVVGHTAEHGAGRIYGLAFLDPAADLWNAQFPAEEPTKTVRLECSGCRAVCAYSLSGIELQMFEASKELSHSCKNCASSRTWRETQRDVTPARPIAVPKPQSKPVAISSPLEERRKNKRTAMKIMACIRYSGEEVIGACEDISKGGFRFVSSKEYPESTRIEAAVPYIKYSTNIFLLASITYCHKLPDGQFRHGAAYTKTSESVDWGR